LSQVIDGVQIAGLSLFEIAIESRGEFETPTLLVGIGDLHGDALLHAGDVKGAALEQHFHAARAGIECTAGVACGASANIISGASGDTGRRSAAMSERGERRNARYDCGGKVKRDMFHGLMLARVE